MDTQVADPLLGSLIDGRYRIRGRVARGGMATVYTAVDERLERTVAVKVIHPAHAREGQFVERFTDEAKTIARLTHPNVVAVYDQGTHWQALADPSDPGAGGRGLPYLVMEYVRGHTLRDVLVERRRLNPIESLAILEQMLAAIAAAHRAGLVHRDVKPENVLVAEAPSGGSGNLVDSVVKVADFGLARAVEASAEDPAGGQLMATVAYVAPELVTDGRADPRTDVYSAGIVLFEMLTGRVPYDGDRPVEVAWQHVDQDVPPPSKFVPGLPPALDDLVGRATRRDPGGRPTDAGAMLAEVQAVRDDLGATPASTARLRPVAGPTMMVAPVHPAERPAWAGSPVPRTYGGTSYTSGGMAGGAGGGGRLDRLRRKLMGDPRARIALIAAVIVLGLLVVFGGWWLTIGRYTTAPDLVSLNRAQALAQASNSGVKLRTDAGQYREDVPKDTVLAQNPAKGSRIVKGGTVTVTLSLGPQRETVPDVVGMTFDVASEKIQAANLTVVRGDDKFDDNLPAGSVLSVDPAVNTVVKPGAKVTVTVSKGKASISVPSVIGLNINDAIAKLQQLGLQVDQEQVDSPDKPAGQVINQDPAAGSGVEKDTHVKLQISKGPPLVTVPPVVGMKCQDAKAQLEGQGFKVTIQGFDQSTVRFQNPAENSQVPSGTEITLGCIF